MIDLKIPITCLIPAISHFSPIFLHFQTLISHTASSPSESIQVMKLAESLCLSATDSADSQRAWHIFSLLVFIGKPTPLRDLASKCTLFPASPTLIYSLCFIQNSPITLSNNNRFVAISSIGLSIFATYLAQNFTVANAFTWPPVRFGGLTKIWLGKRQREGISKNKHAFYFYFSICWCNFMFMFLVHFLSVFSCRG